MTDRKMPSDPILYGIEWTKRHNPRYPDVDDPWTPIEQTVQTVHHPDMSDFDQFWANEDALHWLS